MPRAKRHVPTIADVAQAARVSPTTVSFVINNAPHANIPEETRQRVHEAVRQLGYRPNAAAKVLRTNQTNTIGFVTDEIASTPFAGKTIQGAQDCAWKHNKLLVIINTGREKALLETAVHVLLDRQVEGIVYAAMFHQEVQPPEALHEVPSVLLDCFSADRSLPSVVPDEVGGGRAATELLLSAGHRRIGFINLDPTLQAAPGRLAGYRAALADAGIVFDPALVRSSNSNADGGYLEALALMRGPNPPTALFCGTDRIAMGAYDALHELGYTIPHDVSVVGFDNQELIAAFLRPALSTIELPHYEMGRWAIEYLINMTEDTGPPRQLQMPCPPVPRASVGPPRPSAAGG